MVTLCPLSDQLQEQTQREEEERRKAVERNRLQLRPRTQFRGKRTVSSTPPGDRPRRYLRGGTPPSPPRSSVFTSQWHKQSESFIEACQPGGEHGVLQRQKSLARWLRPRPGIWNAPVLCVSRRTRPPRPASLHPVAKVRPSCGRWRRP